ncbi:MAG: 4-hydroxy-3-methylbut-2-en-1-yl diphosphate synthase [candidate division Zixibacteria bacterium]|nr:4-hydroxy-3-methylbut-2-en-1-yl diphosphate synthase [candidate division Zixibacteria bacterium]
MQGMREFRERLASGGVCLGASVTFTDPTVTEALCDSVDFIWIDTEHNPMTLESVTGHLIAARACGKAALVRVPTSETAYIKRTLDAGAPGIIVPQVRTAAEVRRVVSDCRYAPMGSRGFGPRRPSNYGRLAGDAYISLMNREIFVAVQIEHIDAVRELNDIVATPGLDSLVIGPMDLSGSMGLLGQPNHPDVVQMMETVIDTGRKAGLSIGMGMGTDLDFAVRWMKRGVQWLQLGCDFGYLIERFDGLSKAIRG